MRKLIIIKNKKWLTNDKNIDKIPLENFGEVKEMSTLKVGENESLESAIKRFKRKCQKDGIIGDIRKKEAYVKPSVKRKKKSEAAQKRNRKG